jgi:hypothetical protein
MFADVALPVAARDSRADCLAERLGAGRVLESLRSSGLSEWAQDTRGGPMSREDTGPWSYLMPSVNDFHASAVICSTGPAP